LRNAFEFNDKKRLFGTLILLDDIHTSGSTLAEAARTLYLAGAQNVAAITVARALLHNT
jgi:predicted amidophosphoribosyltransferase